jgi:uncharacterized protein YaaQ
MKLVISIVNNDDAQALIHALLTKGHRATRMTTTGGFLRIGNTTILCGAEDHRLASVLETIRIHCHTRVEREYPLPAALVPDELHWSAPLQVEVGGATVFVFDVERFERF